MTPMPFALVVVAGVFAGNAWGVEQDAGAPSVEYQIDLEETEVYGEQVNCIELRRIRYTRVVDYRRMLFYMRDKIIYLNQFESQCEQLTDRRITSFNTSFNGRLCKMDRLEVLHDLHIPEYRSRGRTDYQILSWCFVGAFEPVTPAQADLLRTKRNRSGITDMIGGGEVTEKDPR